jgi:two-component system response regulator QseB
MIRRSSGQLTPELRHGALVLYPRTSKVILDGEPVKLTSHESQEVGGTSCRLGWAMFA